jgi:MATE family multidrug resistance protein
MTYMLYLGVSVSGNVRIGNAIGSGDMIRAESASLVTLGMGALASLLNITFLLSFRKTLPWLITTDLDIVQEAQRLFIVAAVFQFPDAIGACVQGIFRGSGRQALAAKLNFAAYYIIGVSRMVMVFMNSIVLISQLTMICFR